MPADPRKAVKVLIPSKGLKHFDLGSNNYKRAEDHKIPYVTAGDMQCGLNIRTTRDVGC